MGLLAECKFCHQFFSERRMAEHIQRNHFAVARADKPRMLETSALLPMSRSPKKPKSAKRQPMSSTASNQAVRQPTAETAQPGRDFRIVRAELEQHARRNWQAAKNKATASFVKDSTLQKINKDPLSSVWKEQVAKLSTVNSKRHSEHSYSLQLQKVPVREVPPPTQRPLVKTKGKAVKQLSTKLTLNRPALLANIPCSCGGENENCYRCFGAGYYEVSEADAMRLARQVASTPAPQRLGPVRFASDARGAAYGLREQGRFSSEPVHDDYGDDSSS